MTPHVVYICGLVT